MRTAAGVAQDYPAVGRVTFFSVKRAEANGAPEASEWTADMVYTRCAGHVTRFPS